MRRFIGALGLLILTTGCVAPYNDARREAGQRDPVGQSKNGVVAICYHPWRDEMPAVQQAAQEICAQSSKKAVLQNVKHLNCTIVAPDTAFFKCQ